MHHGVSSWSGAGIESQRSCVYCLRVWYPAGRELRPLWFVGRLSSEEEATDFCPGVVLNAAISMHDLESLFARLAVQLKQQGASGRMSIRALRKLPSDS